MQPVFALGLLRRIFLVFDVEFGIEAVCSFNGFTALMKSNMTGLMSDPCDFKETSKIN
jgi:hypothetical protein